MHMGGTVEVAGKGMGERQMDVADAGVAEEMEEVDWRSENELGVEEMGEVDIVVLLVG